MDNKVRISELPEAGSLAGLYTLGTDADNVSVKVALGDALAGKQDTLTAGENITIRDNVISATGGGGSDVEPITDDEIDGLLERFAFLGPLDITAQGEAPLTLTAGRDGSTFTVGGSVDIGAIGAEEIEALF